MSRYRYVRNAFTAALDEVPPLNGMAAAAIAQAAVGIEAFRSLRFEDLPAEVIQQLRQDGTRGDLRDLQGAQQVYQQNVPNEAKGSLDGVKSITNDPSLDWMHRHPHADGGSNAAPNGVYGPEHLNQVIGDRPMSPAEIHQAHAHTDAIASHATPGMSGDLGHVAGHALHTATLGGLLGGGIAVAHRYAQAKGFRDVGRHDLAAVAEEQLGSDVARATLNGVVRGTSVAVTQAVLGANPLTAGIGLVAPDVVSLLTQKDHLSETEIQGRALGIAGKGALATALICVGPVGWLGLMGVSVAAAYGKATSEGCSPQLQRS